MNGADIVDIYPLSPMQQGMLFHDVYDGGKQGYFVQLACTLRGPQEPAMLERAWQQAAAQYPVLRTVFAWEGLDEPVQVVLGTSSPALVREDLRSLSAAEQEARIAALLEADRASPFALMEEPPLRLLLCELADDRARLVVSFHHLLLDGWSGFLLLRRVLGAYEALCDGREPAWPESRPYRDYIAHLRSRSTDVADFWRRRLAGFESPNEIDGGAPRGRAPEPQAGLGGTRRSDRIHHLAEETTAALAELARRSKVTPSTLIQGAWALLVGSYSHRDDVVFGVTVANRPTDLPGAEEMLGLFINTLPLRVRLDPGASALSLFGAIQAQMLEHWGYDHTSLAQIQKWSDVGGGRALFDSLVVFENYRTDGALADLGRVRVEDLWGHDQTNYPLTLVIMPGSRLALRLSYDTERFDAPFVDRLLAHLGNLLEDITRRPEARLGELGYLSAAELRDLEAWNTTGAPLPEDRGIHRLFEAQARERPDAVAVIDGDVTVTYAELDRRADRVARALVRMGVERGARVALCGERSAAFIAGVLGIVKVGAAYVPIDPGYPDERIELMVRDTGSAALLTVAALRERLRGVEVPILDLEASMAAPDSGDEPLFVPCSGRDLALVVYTSGSTGKPKGVLLEHRALMRTFWDARYAPLSSTDRVAHISNVCFDAAIWEIWSALSHGARVVVFPKDTVLSPRELVAGITRHGITAMLLTTALFNYAVDAAPEALGGLSYLLFGAEKADPARVRRLLEVGKPRHLVHMYGPAESTIYASSHEVTRAEDITDVVPIGRPLANTTVYVLDRLLCPVPTGVAGELYIGGDGLARGYHARPGLTAERFLPNPFGPPGGRLYRTGDVVRRGPSGDLVFVGRVDRQVKIRGFRIEPGEIEEALRRHPAVRDAVVTVVVEDDHKRLCAYAACDTSDARVEPEALRAFLAEHLPDYMVPASFVVLDELPLTPNGKVDRAALPVARLAPREPTAPRTDVERTLCALWAELLGVPAVGIDDNFFALGGDSIISLRVVGRAREAGVPLTPRLLFKHPTIGALAAALAGSEVAPEATQASATGPVPLTPIQRWFFDLGLSNVHHFTQTFLFELGRPLSADVLTRALAAVVAHHGALRLRFRRADDGAWTQACVETTEPPVVRDIDLSAATDVDRALRDEARALAATLDIGAGPLLAAARACLGSGRPDRLLLSVHHLAIDVVSWGILLSDLERACQQLEGGAPVRLPPEVTSWKRWGEALSALARQDALLAERAYWREQVVEPDLPVDFVGGVGTLAGRRVVSVELDADTTEVLAARANGAYDTRPLDLLLAAFARAVCRWSGRRALSVSLERHGREDLDEGLDVSRTIGWFTTIAPVALVASEGGDPGEDIQQTRARLGAVPRGGIGYGLLRHLRDDPAIAAELAASPAVSFNYLGRSDATFGPSTFALVDEIREAAIAGEGQSPHLFDVVCVIRGGKLRVEWQYSEERHARATVERLAASYLEELCTLAAHCLPLSRSGRSRLSDELASTLFGGADRVEDAYPLTSTQEGLLFHERDERGEQLYMEQICFELAGPVDRTRLEAALGEVAARHPALRTQFVRDNAGEALQVVVRGFVPPVRAVDLRATGAALSALLAEERAAVHPFRAPPIRVLCAELEDARFALAFTFHHVLLDGWSVSLVVNQLFDVYRSLGAGASPPRPEVRPYRDFIDWLQKRPAFSELYWREALDGFDAGARLPAASTAAPGGGIREAEATLDARATATIKALAQREHVTTNTIAEAALALVLGRYLGTNDVIFGVTVAGRPYELAGVEAMVGLFINTLPLRLSWRADAPVSALLAATHEAAQRLGQHEHDALAHVQRSCGAGGGLFEVLFVFENYPLDRSFLDETTGLRVVDVSSRERTNYPLTIAVLPGEELSLRAIYDVGRLGEGFGEAILGHLARALAALAASPGSRVCDLALVSEEERRRVLVEWNQTDAEYPRDAALGAVFSAEARKHPHATAITHGDRTLSYGELEVRANRLAHRLLSLGVGREARVGVWLERSTDFVVSVLGILKAGAAYVPLDPAYPDERLRYMLEDAGCRHLLGRRAELGRLGGTGLALLCVEDELDRVARLDPENHDEDPGVAWGGDALAYVMYTSGSTGRPKGVMIPHRGVMRIAVNSGFAPLGRDDVMAHLSNVSFDAATWEIWGALLNGARLAVLDQDEVLGDLGATLRARGVTAMFVTAALFNRCVDEAPATFASVEHTLVGGEALDVTRVRRALTEGGQRRVINGYGPTECVTFSATHEARALAEGATSVPIGRGVGNLRLYVLDRDLNPVPVGVPGELYVAGDGLSRGYANSPAMTASKLVPDPFSRHAGSRMYRTGDIVRWNGEGALEFVGRADGQVKIRGFRIERGEIEAVLREHDGVTDAVVLVKGEGADKRLVAYVAAPGGVDERALRERSRARLPEYMQPSAVVVLERLPLSPGGKVDRSALAEPTREGASTKAAGPVSPVEEALLGIWSDVLGRGDVGIHDDFFELGGHSLLAARVVSRVRAVFQVDLPLRDLFVGRTIAAVARQVESARGRMRLGDAGPIPCASREGDLPLSFAQQRLWFLSRMAETASRAYHVVAAYRLEGPLHEEALRRSLTEILARHEALRTTFPSVGGRPFQVIGPPEPIDLSVHDLLDVEGPEREDALAALLAEEARRPFDLSRGPLFRGALVRLGAEEHALVLSMHHIVADGWSIGVLFHEMEVLYEAFARGAPSPLPPLRIQVADFAAFQRTQLDGATLEKLLAYWKQQLGPTPPVLELPADHPRGRSYSYAGGHLAFRIPQPLGEQLRALARARGATDFMLLLAAFYTLLYRHTGQEDIAVGAPAAGRSHVDIEPLIGFFVNTIVLRTSLAKNLSFLDVLERVRETTLAAYDHQDLPFERLVEELAPARDLGRTPLYQAMFTLQRPSPLGLAGLSARPLDVQHDTAKVDLTLELTQDPEGLLGRIEYNADLFERSSAARMAERYVRLLEAIARSPSTQIGDIELMSAEERRRVLFEWNETDADYPRDTAVGAVFSAEARKHQDAIAILEGEQTLTYGELERRTNRLAHRLLALGVAQEERVGVCLERSTAFVVTVLAILKAGAAYVPLDPTYPDERLHYMLQDAGCRRLLCSNDALQRFEGTSCAPLSADDELARIVHMDPGAHDQDPGVASGGEALAYVMYTSGSTGRPKGVMVPHRGVLRIAVNSGFAPLGPDDVMAHISNVSFDAATWELWGALLSGARLAVLHRDDVLGELGAALRARRVTAMFVTAALFNRCVDEAPDTFASVEHLLVGGEALDATRVRRAFVEGGQGRVINGYGPTECVTFSATHEVRALAADAAAVPIGRGVGNLRLYVLDAHGDPVPPGVAGELFVAGDAIARGYHGNSRLTAARFVPDPFSAAPGGRMYRTGDLVRWNVEGSLDFLGRADDQVKIRGFRIEPGEIEAVLRELSGVAGAIVVVKGQGADKRLVAYVEAKDPLEERALRDHLRARLPEYMQPAAVVLLDRLPLSPGGKVDRAALPDPTSAAVPTEAVAPRSPKEEALARIWAEVLERGSIGVHDNFFELGGHSLLATQAISRIRKAFGRNVPLRSLFEAPTVAEYARKFLEGDGAPPDGEKDKTQATGIKRLVRPPRRSKP
ncbi:non-ribosomal peptide synthetase [Polyangium sp. 15x6]|uniref:non-ribosomal peptide synthetase n=1 Tax=Polyangium sp. 15x6 TaxID=3042687 RepID=UPI002499BCF2|nr:non-ribosomal peptide synthetase [Polyangium sp. 15x6]MDI3288328.1 amino acid adenylation domain-containing protein [Polyangium sp. 15x6]